MDTKGSKIGFDASLFRRAVKIAAGQDNSFVPVQIFDAIVQAGSQSNETMTCVVDSCDSTLNNLTVRYNLCISDGEIKVPSDLSVVTIAKTSFTDPYIVKETDLNSYFLGIGNQSYSNNGEIQNFESYVSEGAGSFGGFIKSIDPSSSNSGLLYRINLLEKTLNKLLNYWNAFSSAYVPGSPSTTGLPASLASDNVPIISPITERNDLENKNIVHGLTLLP